MNTEFFFSFDLLQFKISFQKQEEKPWCTRKRNALKINKEVFTGHSRFQTTVPENDHNIIDLLISECSKTNPNTFKLDLAGLSVFSRFQESLDILQLWLTVHVSNFVKSLHYLTYQASALLLSLF